METILQRRLFFPVISLVAMGFGLLSINEGGEILFGNEAARRAAGDYVPFVLWFNFLAGFAYLLVGVGLWIWQYWASRLAIAIALATALTFVALGAHIYAGGAFEARTIVAMSLRTLLWLVIAAIVWRIGLPKSC